MADDDDTNQTIDLSQERARAWIERTKAEGRWDPFDPEEFLSEIYEQPTFWHRFWQALWPCYIAYMLGFMTALPLGKLLWPN